MVGCTFLEHCERMGGGVRLRSRRGAMMLAVVSAVAIANTPSAAQIATGRSFEEFQRSAAQASSSRSLEVRLLWSTATAVRDPTRTTNRLQVLSIQRVAIRSTPARGTGVTSERLLAALEDASGRVIAWRMLRDPRIVRAESASAPVLNGQTLYYVQTELLLLLPDTATATRLRVYSIASQQGVAVLRAIGVVRLR